MVRAERAFATEFGRTPGSQGSDGRDHHPYGFSVWMAGGGIKGGTIHGATDELGFHAVEHLHYVTDVHATILHLLGLNPRSLEVPGYKRLSAISATSFRKSWHNQDVSNRCGRTLQPFDDSVVRNQPQMGVSNPVRLLEGNPRAGIRNTRTVPSRGCCDHSNDKLKQLHNPETAYFE